MNALLINSGLREVMYGGDLLYFGEEYAEGYIDHPEEEIERLERKEARRKALARRREDKHV